MRIAHVITRLIIGGAQENTLASVLGLRELAGVQVQLLTGPTTGPEGSLEPIAQAAPGLLTTVPSLVRPVSPWQDWQAWRELVRLFRAQRPDIVHTHSGKAGVLGRLAAHKARVPLILHTIHGPSFGPFQGAVANTVFRTMEQWAGRVTDHFVTVADAMRDQYLAAGIGQPSQYTRIFSGFKLAPFLSARNSPELRARLGLAPDAVVVGKIARLFELKGHDDLLEALPRLSSCCPKLHVLLVGDGAWRDRLEQKAESLGVRHLVTFTGLVSPQEIPALTGIMDFLVHLSRREGLPRALPQALAAGKPVVAYDCDGAREVCLEGETGFLVAPGAAKPLSERIQQLYQDPLLRRRLGEAGRNYVRLHFDEQFMVARLWELYQRLSQAGAEPKR